MRNWIAQRFAKSLKRSTLRSCKSGATRFQDCRCFDEGVQPSRRTRRRACGLFNNWHQWPGASERGSFAKICERSEPNRSPRRTTGNSPYKGKRSAALGQSLKMNTSLFSKLCWPCQHNFEKREIGGGGGLPRTAASGALSWAIILLPLRGVGRSRPEANKVQ